MWEKKTSNKIVDDVCVFSSLALKHVHPRGGGGMDQDLGTVPPCITVVYLYSGMCISKLFLEAI